MGGYTNECGKFFSNPTMDGSNAQPTCTEEEIKAYQKQRMETPKKGQRPTQNSLLSWECSACDGLDVECQLLCKGKKLLIWGGIAYVGYRLLIKKK